MVKLKSSACTNACSPEYSNVFEIVVYILSRESIKILLTNNVYCSAELGFLLILFFQNLRSKVIDIIFISD